MIFVPTGFKHFSTGVDTDAGAEVPPFLKDAGLTHAAFAPGPLR